MSQNRCGYCNNFILDDKDAHIIPVGFCTTTSELSSLVDFHRAECVNFNINAKRNRSINCKGCNKELRIEYECTCVRIHTAEEDLYKKNF